MRIKVRKIVISKWASFWGRTLNFYFLLKNFLFETEKSCQKFEICVSVAASTEIEILEQVSDQNLVRFFLLKII